MHRAPRRIPGSPREIEYEELPASENRSEHRRMGRTTRLLYSATGTRFIVPWEARSCATARRERLSEDPQRVTL